MYRRPQRLEALGSESREIGVAFAEPLCAEEENWRNPLCAAVPREDPVFMSNMSVVLRL